MKQQIVQREYSNGYSGGSYKQGGTVMLTLACKHIKRVPISKEPKETVSCEECEGAAAFCQGLPESANPYYARDKHSRQTVAWRNGWKQEANAATT